MTEEKATISSLQPSMLPLTFSTLSQQSLTLPGNGIDDWTGRSTCIARSPSSALAQLLQQYFFGAMDIDFVVHRL